ncbi:hypothetical protein ACJMK2_033761, partial [Sinanodonta woodiana]
PMRAVDLEVCQTGKYDKTGGSVSRNMHVAGTFSKAVQSTSDLVMVSPLYCDIYITT